MPDAPSLKDLQAFLEVCDCCNLSRAADRLGITQPGLSVAMRRLEQVVGATLLERSKTGVVPTAAGCRLRHHAQSLCEQWQRTRDRVLAARNEVAGGYVLGCHTAVASYALGFLADFLRRHPNLHLSLNHDLSRRVLEATVSMRCDMGLVINAKRHPDLVLRRLCRDQVTLFVAPGDKPVADVLICDPSLYQSQEILRTLQRRQQAYVRVLESSSLEVVAQLVSAGVGVGVLPRNVAALFNLQPVPHAPTYDDELFFIYRVENKTVPAVRAMARALSEFFATQARPAAVAS